MYQEEKRIRYIGESIQEAKVHQGETRRRLSERDFTEFCRAWRRDREEEDRRKLKRLLCKREKASV